MSATTPQLVLSAAARWGDHPAVVDDEVVISYAELADRVLAVGSALVAAGVQPGHRVSIWAPNIHEWIVVALGIHAAGGVLIPINTRFKGAEAADIIERGGVRTVFTVSGFLGADYVGLLRDAGVELDHVVVLRGDVGDGAESFESFLERGGSVGAEVVHERLAAVAPGNLSDILFTSGTTGRPKGVMTTHEQNLRAFATWAELVGLRSDDRYLVINPFFHSFGYKAGILAALMTGATLYPQAVFDVDEALARIERDRISMIPGPPTLYQSILSAPDLAERDLSSLRLAVTGAAAIPVSLIERMRDELGFETVLTAYGLTEACGVVTMCRDGDDATTIATTSGRAIPGIELACVDATGAPVPTGEAGEVVARGYNVMVGYLDDPAATAEAVDTDGWLHTGDVGVLDDQGNLRITDRTKDLFIVGGFNVYPAEVENLMLNDERIAQVAVIGVPDERMGEVGLAFVMLRPGQSATPDEIVAWCREHMANYKVPRRVEIVDSLPLNATGKVLKYELRARASQI
jgi:acyl-CoA synthetase (AMP-forming)/AMP-acid ligase II